jgi:predicted ATP-grasp superfamily ATP-dependent carboligase
LSIDLKGVKLGTSKLVTQKYFIENEISTPKSYKIPSKAGIIDLDFVLQKFNQLGNSIIIKPEDGAGSEFTFHFDDKEQLLGFFNKPYEKLDRERNYIVQEFIAGEDLSISIINRSNLEMDGKMNQIILSINTQSVQNLRPPKKSGYLGGSTPIQNFKAHKDMFEGILRKMDLSSFQGYFGIDFIIKVDKSIVFIEINPRLTTSYIGIRNILDYNPVELLLNQALYNIEMTKKMPKRFSEFMRLELKYSGYKPFDNIIEEIIPNLIEEIPELVTPPITVQNTNNKDDLVYSCFISTKAKNLKTSNKRISVVLTILEKYNFYEIK